MIKESECCSSESNVEERNTFGERKAASTANFVISHAEGCLPSPEDDEGSRLSRWAEM
jgi:hypothetical protein